MYSDGDMEDMSMQQLSRVLQPPDTEWPDNIAEPPPLQLTEEEERQRDAAVGPRALMCLAQQVGPGPFSPSLAQFLAREDGPRWEDVPDRDGDVFLSGYKFAGALNPDAETCLLIDYWDGVVVLENEVFDLRHENLADRIYALRRRGITTVAVIESPDLDEREVLRGLWDLVAIDAALLVSGTASLRRAIEELGLCRHYVVQAAIPEGRERHTSLASIAWHLHIGSVDAGLALGDFPDDPALEWEDCPFVNHPPSPEGSPLGWGGVDGRPPHPIKAPHPIAGSLWD
jgi:hypothetical protein